MVCNLPILSGTEDLKSHDCDASRLRVRSGDRCDAALSGTVDRVARRGLHVVDCDSRTSWNTGLYWLLYDQG